MENTDLGISRKLSETNFDILFYQSPQPMLIFEVETLQILEVNQAAIDCYGYSREAFLALTTRDLRVQEERSSFDELVPDLKGEQSVYAEAQHHTKDGRVIHVDIVSYVIEYNNQVCRIGQIHDVSSKVKQARNLQVLLSIGASIADDLDAGSIMQKVTDATTQLSGAEAGAFYYKNFGRGDETTELCTISQRNETVFHKLAFAKDYRALDAILMSAEVIRIDNVFADRKSAETVGCLNNILGDFPFASFMAVPVISKAKSVLGVMFFGHKIAGVFGDEAQQMVIAVSAQAAIALENATLFGEVNHAKKEKEALLEQAQAQNFKKDEFLSIASHELKTPVTSMKGYLQLLEKQLKKGGDTLHSDLITKANGQVNRLVRLVSELLNFSKLESGKMEYHFTHFSINELIDDCINSINSSKASHKIKMFGESDCVIHADKNRIEQVIINLVDNAIKYSPAANEVLIGLSKRAGVLKFEVRDFGAGIDREKRHLIFNRYYRCEDNSYKSSGLGLGLYISAEIIKQHHGEIGVESEVGKGSTFWFSIPLSQAK